MKDFCVVVDYDDDDDDNDSDSDDGVVIVMTNDDRLALTPTTVSFKHIFL